MDIVGDNIEAKNAHWTFSGGVTDIFDDHVSKSVPLYHEGHQLIAQMSDFVVTDGSVCYELGCSTGQLTKILAERHAERSARFIGVDVEADMVAKAREKCEGMSSVQFVVDDLAHSELETTDLVVSYYTMQFVRPKFRQQLFDRIYQALNWGGIFLLFEKVRGPDARFQDMVTQIYLDYKLERGYKPAEVVGKMRSLKGVLEPFSEQGNLDLMRRAGFQDITTVMKYLCFQGFMAIK